MNQPHPKLDFIQPTQEGYAYFESLSSEVQGMLIRGEITTWEELQSIISS